VNFTLGMGGAVFFGCTVATPEGLRTWACDHQLVQHPQSRFGTVCAGMRFHFAMGWGIGAVEDWYW